MQRRQKPGRPRNVKAAASTIEQNIQNTTNLQNVVVLQDDNTSAVVCQDEAQKISETPAINHLSKDNKILNNFNNLDQKNTYNLEDSKINNTNRLAAKSKRSLNNDNHVKDSEVDGKIDSEDIKASSSSENSNDSRVLDFNTDGKSSLNQLNDSENKPGFRSRSGSTDTTGSESGSNSGVRRSNRIRSIGLLKQRSRGRGLVTKPSVVDHTKIITQPNQDKITNKLVSINEKDSLNKDGSEQTTETSDKENNSKSITSIQDGHSASSTATTLAGYDSDSNKPVKVKSRWRRSSELEMSNSGSWAVPQPNSGLSHLPSNETLTGVVAATTNDHGIILACSSSGLSLDCKSATSIQDMVNALSLKNNQNSFGSNSFAQDPKSASKNSNLNSIGTKNLLPMIQESADREMEERLSQFEHLKENLYLTERYTNKETKRMVCDCFLTEEEVQRGELGCGEDCLNRLLMIECGSRCVVADRCTNKRFQNCEYSNCEVFRTEKKGFGLRATTDLNAGDFIMEYVGEVVDPKNFRKRAKEYSKDKNRHYYFMALKSDQIIDATMKGNISRFINHSCDPNAETQKWTVNGELRIGFFIKKFVASGEEITFDYHFQRYGKEAQKCFCEAENCRGWIGDNPDDSKEKMECEEEDAEEDESETEEESEDEVENKENKENKEDKEIKPKKQVRRKKREEKKVSEHMEDEDLEEQIDKLCFTGLKNRTHTLTLSRLMVRSREIHHRTRLLKVIQTGDQACRRLFLDYHGLRLMWSYMMDLGTDTNEEAQQFRVEVLKTLATLPIPNRTMLIDSKVLDIVEKWSKQLYHSTSGESPEDDQSKLKTINENIEMDTSEVNSESQVNDAKTVNKDNESEIKKEIKSEDLEQNLIPELADNLLVSWSTLKEVFRIPKKERIEQMKEHEREADRDYKENAESVEGDGKENSSYDRFRADKYNKNDLDKRLDRKKGKESPDFEYGRSKDKRVIEERPNLVVVPRMSKFERRQLFAMKVAKEEEEKQRRQQEDLWQQHEAQCRALGMDPFTTAAFDSQTGYPLFFNPQLGQWQPYPIQAAEGQELGAAGSYVPTPGIVPQELVPGTTSVYSLVQGLKPPTIYGSTPSPAQIQNGISSYGHDNKLSPDISPTPAPPPPLDLPPKWKWARDKRGRIYYYQTKERISQWLPPPPDHIAVQPDSSSCSESSDESSEDSDEDETELEDQPHDSDITEQPQLQQMEVENSDGVLIAPVTSVPEGKKRRDGLVQERIISPRREEDRIDHKKFKETKEKLRRLKEKKQLKEQLEKIKKHRRSSKSKSHAKHITSKLQITSDMSPTQERRIKDTFRVNMANVMVQFLNPYRKNDCKQGRITNTEDFKHLARKLTHFVLAKELKHCKSVDELECNDNVKHKAKDFVRKYMSKFGAVYQKGSDED